MKDWRKSENLTAVAEMQKIIDAQKSDHFDVLAYVAYAMPPLTREERASKANVEISSPFNPNQQAFLDFVLCEMKSMVTIGCRGSSGM